MHVSIQLTPAEASAAMSEIRQDVAMSSESDLARRVRSILIVLLLIPIGYLWAYFRDVYGNGASWYYAGSIVLVALAISGSRRLVDEKINRYVESSGLLEANDYSFSESGLTVEGGSGRSELTWDAIQKVGDSEEFVLLFVDKSAALIIPKRLPEAERILSLALSSTTEAAS